MALAVVLEAHNQRRKENGNQNKLLISSIFYNLEDLYPYSAVFSKYS
jgi:hypothetical protein